METSTNHMYQNLGKLFYAVAAADGIIRDEEIKALHKVVVNRWQNIDDEEDDFGMDAAFQIEIVFEWLNDQDISAEQCYKDFKFFKSRHESLFTTKINRIIWRTVVAIADAFHGKNKAEKEMLAKIKVLLIK